MVKQELIEKSPLRILEKSTHGGVGAGNIGVIAARKGVGKTACLVHIATDKLLQTRHVIHVSFSGNTDHIVAWYEDIFTEISKRKNLEHAMDVHDELVKYRLIMNFGNHPASVGYIIERIKSMTAMSGFKPDCIIIDGYDFYNGIVEDIAVLKHFAAELGCEVWFSVSLKENPIELDLNSLPTVLTRFLKTIDVVVLLTPAEKSVELKLVKDHDIMPVENLNLRLDTKILLITDEA
jgi:hypothetical protein